MALLYKGQSLRIAPLGISKCCLESLKSSSKRHKLDGRKCEASIRPGLYTRVFFEFGVFLGAGWSQRGPRTIFGNALQLGDSRFPDGSVIGPVGQTIRRSLAAVG